MSEVGVGWKNATTGQIITVPAADIEKMHWIRVAREYELRIQKKGKNVLKFDGFPKDVSQDWILIDPESAANDRHLKPLVRLSSNSTTLLWSTRKFQPGDTIGAKRNSKIPP